jgi:two-component sensor histidine kinase
MVIKNKQDRMNKLTAMLEAHPNGLRKAEIARRLGVHRSTVGRYIDQLSLSLQIWERDSRIGIESVDSQHIGPDLDIYEGTFILFLLKLYEKELNIKNPHASSFIRKISGHYRKTAPVLYQSLMQKAESLETEERRYSRGYNLNLEKMTDAWINGKVVKMNYLHKATGESCSALYEPRDFFLSRKRGLVTDAAVCGLCHRTGESCRLYMSDFSEIKVLSGGIRTDEMVGESFCPVLEFAREDRPNKNSNNTDDYCIKEANHRIKNSLFMTSSLIDITFAGNENQATAAKIKGLHNRIDANDGSSFISLDRYFGKLVRRNISALTPNSDEIKTTLKIDDIQLEAGKVLPLGMIISELITNSFKHAMKSDSPGISLTVTKLDGTLSVRYGDGENKKELSGMAGRNGLKLIDGFCKQLCCKITYKNKHILLEFPV